MNDNVNLFIWFRDMHKMRIIVIRRNIDKVSGFPDIVLGDIYYKTFSMFSKLTKLNLRQKGFLDSS